MDAHTHTHTHAQTRTLSRMQIIGDNAHTRWAYRDMRPLQRSTWLPKDPEAHVNSSLHPTLGLCILTKHLAVSAPVHHSRDPPPPTSPFLSLRLSLHVGRLHSEKTASHILIHCDSVFMNKHCPCIFMCILIIGRRLKLLAWLDDSTYCRCRAYTCSYAYAKRPYT